MASFDYTFEGLMEVMAVLRGENGCPWDREQTHESIKYDTLEEAYEVFEAISNADRDNLVEELGDLMLHVAFHTQIGIEEGSFTQEEVLKGIIDKLIRRHPHVFADISAENSEEVLFQWDEIKKQEKSINKHVDTMKHVPRALPALMRAHKIQKKAAKVDFDFQNEKELFDKFDEEKAEFFEALESGSRKDMEEELGDLLFHTVNISRFFQLNAENALTNAIEKFINRFEGVEEMALSKGLSLCELSPNQMNELWDAVKKQH